MRTNLIELAISTVENNLEGNVGSIFEPGNIRGSEIQVETRQALSGRLEEVSHELVVSTAVVEVVERGSVRRS